MKYLHVFFTAYLIVFSMLKSLAFIAHKDNISQDHLEIVLRDIGHQLLLHAKDSTSTVLPIEKINDHTYQISFENEFVFVPDTLITIVQKQFKKHHLPKEYIVNVKNCIKNTTIYGFEMNGDVDSILPCKSRVHDKACYHIQIIFTGKQHSSFSVSFLFLIPLFFVGVYLKIRKSKKDKVHSTNEDTVIDQYTTEENSNFIRLGKFNFYIAKQVLKLEDLSIDLSEKEVKALKIFSENIDQVIEREMLMKEIWGEEGLVVMSRNVDVLVSKLRKKLGADESIKIINVHGKGYRVSIK